jgi:hypothetical protein
MKGMFRNSRGLRNLAKHSHIADCCKDYNLDFVGDLDFEWFSRPPCGRSGGLLVVILSDTMDVLASSDGEYHIKLTIQNKADDFIWSLVAVYGAAQDAFKADFLRELVNLAKDNPNPMIIGGDFNLLRFHHKKIKGHFDIHWPFLFNVGIDSLDLREVAMVGRQFTRANSLPDPTNEKLDRVLMNTDCEAKYPLVSVRAL